MQSGDKWVIIPKRDIWANNLYILWLCKKYNGNKGFCYRRKRDGYNFINDNDNDNDNDNVTV